MVNPIIKICGVRDADIAVKTAELGANLIGMVFHPVSPRAVNLEQAIAITKAIKKMGAAPVAVFVNQTDIEMRAICEATEIEIVQLHGATARVHHHLLPNEYQRIFVLNVKENGELLPDAGFEYLETTRDMILIDHAEPGQGKMINRQEFHYPFSFPWLLAGGLTPNNVAAMLNELQPNGVDVSSGVEISKAQKDISLIQQFITAVRGYHAA
jgi:phosphoribosylanthranilate isomerase